MFFVLGGDVNGRPKNEHKKRRFFLSGDFPPRHRAPHFSMERPNADLAALQVRGGRREEREQADRCHNS